MKQFTILILAMALAGATAATAQADPVGPACGQPGQPQCEPQGSGRGGDKGDKGDRREGQPDQPSGDRQGSPQGERSGPPAAEQTRNAPPKWSRGDRVPTEYRDNRYAVPDWRQRNLPPAARGYRWMCYEGGNCVLVSNRNGVIRRTWWRDDQDNNWRRRYSRTYTYNDDVYYRECRERADPAGILIGGIIGGLLGRAADGDRAGGTFAGIIIGGTIGAALTRDMDCDDRGYAYRAYYDGLNSGRVGRIYRWRNPSNNHRGEFRVRNYSYDAYGFRCATFSHTGYLERRRFVNGRACRQPDGAWAFMN